MREGGFNLDQNHVEDKCLHFLCLHSVTAALCKSLKIASFVPKSFPSYIYTFIDSIVQYLLTLVLQAWKPTLLSGSIHVRANIRIYSSIPTGFVIGEYNSYFSPRDHCAKLQTWDFPEDLFVEHLS